MSRAKMEVATKEARNAIAQDVKKGKLREYHGPIYWNYGMLPQTWENPHVVNPSTKCSGDNDPLDVVEIGSRALARGSVEPVKALGVLAMIDDGELDWKVIAISANDPLAAALNDISDVEAECPGTISGIREWFRWYKTPDGKPLNAFGFDERALDRAAALEVIGETHEAWRGLLTGEHSRGELWFPAREEALEGTGPEEPAVKKAGVPEPLSTSGAVRQRARRSGSKLQFAVPFATCNPFVWFSSSFLPALFDFSA